MCDNASDNLPEIVLTRPEDGARAFHVLIQDVLPKAKVTKSPLIKIKFIPILPDLAQFKGVIFTSTNGVIATKKNSFRQESYVLPLDRKQRKLPKNWGLRFFVRKRHLKT